MADRVLLIDDDRKLASMLIEYLAGHGLEGIARFTAAAGLAAAPGDYDAVVLDVMLPDLDGFEVCRRIRSTSAVPILMLTARGDPTDRVVGLELGADDYLPKPFDPRELVARLHAILRRTRPQASGPGALRFGSLEIDSAARLVKVNGTARSLTGYQFEILFLLARNAGRVLSRETILDRLKGIEFEAFDRSIDVHISRIRAAIEEDPRNPKRILTMRGAGYLLVKSAGEELP